MTEKRFKFIGDNNIEHIMENELLLPIYDNDKQLTLKENYDLLNELNNKNERLKFENETLKSNYQREIQSSINFCNTYSKTNGELLDKIDKLEKENKQLKRENKKLEQDCDNLIDDNTELVVELNQDNKKLKEVLEENEQLKNKNQKQENLINSQNKVIEELENWFNKWGFDVVNYRILDEIMEHFLGDD